jgi:hypothetical protein
MTIIWKSLVGVAMATATFHANAAQLASQSQLSSKLGAAEVIETFEGKVPLPNQQLHTTAASLNSTNSDWISRPGATYSASELYLNVDGYYGLSTRTLADATRGRPITISYDIPTIAMGFDLQGYVGYCSDGTVNVYGPTNALLASISVSAGQFFGWEDPAGIGRVTLSVPAGCYLMIDNHGYGQGVPIGAPPSANYQGLWWNAQESGWGINFAHQGDIVFATWFTYGSDNQPQWYTIRAQKTANYVYSGPVSSFTGLPFNTLPYTANANVKTAVGTAAIVFAADGRSATFMYTVNGDSQTKQIVPQQFAAGVPLPTCVWGAQPDLTQASNYQDLWWVTDGQESGWGINFTHQGNVIFATWFTYDATGKAWWLFSVAAQTAVPKVYSGLIKAAVGPPFSADPFDPNAVVRTPVGNATITIIDGNHATFSYTVNGVTQTKNLARQVFAPPGTVCQ